MAKVISDSEKSTSPEAGKSIVQSLAKGFLVLEAFSADKPEMSLTEVARRADLDPGTTFRLLNTLAMLGYVERVPETRFFRLGLKVTDLGFNAIGRTDLRDIARPILRGLVRETSEAASLAVLDGADMLFVERVRAGLTRLGVDIRPGTTIPAYCSGIGQALLAFLPDEEVEQILAMEPRSQHRPLVPLDRAALRERLQAARRDGFIYTDSLITHGLRIIAAPVADQGGHAVAAVSVCAPAVRATQQEFIDQSVPALRNATDQIGRALAAGGGLVASYG